MLLTLVGVAVVGVSNDCVLRILEVVLFLVWGCLAGFVPVTGTDVVRGVVFVVSVAY